MDRPTTCTYCRNGTRPAPSSDGRTTCGFCEGGVPLDTQEDWDNSWGRVFDTMNLPREEFLAKFAKNRLPTAD